MYIKKIIYIIFSGFFVNWYDICFFSVCWKSICVRQDFKIILRGLQMNLSHNLSMQILIILGFLKNFTGRDHFSNFVSLLL